MEIANLVRKLMPTIQLDLLSDIKKLEIQADSLEEIALFAAESLSRDLNVDFFIEDAGLFIDALNGFPGPYSNFAYKTIGCRGILKLMNGISKRDAEFRSVIVLRYKGLIKIFKGVCKGRISNDIRGNFGFGFDPIFIPEGSLKTFGEMNMEEKNEYSHRAKAIKLMIDFIKTLF